MKVTGWTWWGDPEYIGMDVVIEDDPKYQQYLQWLEFTKTRWDEIDAAVIDALREGGYMFTGSFHQCGDTGCPIIDGKYLAEYSQRSWGDIMARAYPETVGDKYEKGYEYLAWAWDIPQGSKGIVPPEGE